LVEGITLFNHRQFYAAHDTIEQLWLATRGPERDLYRGLIQAAVACHHWSRGNRGGALTLFRSSSRHLAKYGPDCFGVDVAGFLRRYTELFEWLRRHRTRYDARLVPTIGWLRPV
jgi:predicted metal-dependent hydrolase